MRTKEEIQERISLLESTNEMIASYLDGDDEQSVRGMFNLWFAGNLKEIEILTWVLGYEIE